MPEITNLAAEMERQLPSELVEFMQEAGIVAANQGETLYLVGGVVRDLLLKRANFDIDLLVRGDAIALAKKLAGVAPAKMTVHPRFGTATISWGNWMVDIATCRSEHYDRPGALPTVHPGDIHLDLFRRDFTINAMAIELIPSRWGEIIDLYGGLKDLEARKISILHEDSFIDDATRIWRGLRYEQRLDFRIEPKTLRLLKRDIPMLETISGDRIRHELERILKEESPEKVFRRADQLGVLPELHPALKGDAWLTRKFKQARGASASNPLSADMYLALLAYRLSVDETEKLISRLRLNKTQAKILEESNCLKSKLESLAEPGLSPSQIYSIFGDFGLHAITVNGIATDSPLIRRRINLFLTKLRHVKPALNGSDLLKAGIFPGPRMKETLKRLLEARLNGEVKSKQGERELVERWIEGWVA